MPHIVTCDCGKRLAAPESAAGRSARCPSCGTSILVPFALNPPIESKPAVQSSGEQPSEKDRAALADLFAAIAQSAPRSRQPAPPKKNVSNNSIDPVLKMHTQVRGQYLSVIFLLGVSVFLFLTLMFFSFMNGVKVTNDFTPFGIVTAIATVFIAPCIWFVVAKRDQYRKATAAIAASSPRTVPSAKQIAPKVSAGQVKSGLFGGMYRTFEAGVSYAIGGPLGAIAGAPLAAAIFEMLKMFVLVWALPIFVVASFFGAESYWKNFGKHLKRFL